MDARSVIHERAILLPPRACLDVEAGNRTHIRRPFRMWPGMRWYGGPGELDGEAGGDVCEIDGPGWWHVSELACLHGFVGDRLWVWCRCCHRPVRLASGGPLLLDITCVEIRRLESFGWVWDLEFRRVKGGHRWA